MIGGLHYPVNTILLAHNPQINSHIPERAFKLGPGFTIVKLIKIHAIADNRRPLVLHIPALTRDVAIGLICGNDQIREFV